MASEERTSAEKSFPTVGRWLVTSLPRGWMFVARYGVRQMQMMLDPAAVPADISLEQTELADADGFGGYVANQSRLILSRLFTPIIAGPQLTTFPGAAEAWLFFVRHTSPNGLGMLLAQTYIRQDRWVGIVTLPTHEPQLATVRPDYEAFLKGLRITGT